MEMEEGWITKSQEETLGGDTNVYFPYCVDGFTGECICQNSSA